MMKTLDPGLLIPIDLVSWVKERDRLLIEEEDATFRAARDRATTDDERINWGEFIALRERNLRTRMTASASRS